ncbi:MAG: PspC domain-containing protein, partial [Halioglobus sp.]|nr:PspC domain-containing protein [Halioglobus sp.]
MNKPYDRQRSRAYRGSRGHQGFHARREAGWGFNLYRNKRQGMIAGVAAGLADYWDIAPWVVRLCWIGLFIFSGGMFAISLYVAAWFLLAPRPQRRNPEGGVELEYEDVEVEMEYDERHHHYRPRKVFRYSDSSSVRLRRARERLDAALRR